MNRLLSRSLLHHLALTLIVVGVAIALPAAHAQSLHTPDAGHGAGTSDRDCSLSTCGAFMPDWVALHFMITLAATALLELRSSLPLSIPLIIDPPPRSSRA